MSCAFDFVAVVVLVGCAVLGSRRGFFPELLDEVALIGGIVLAGALQASGVRLLDWLCETHNLAMLLQFLLVVTGTTMSVRLVARKLSAAVDKTALRPLNRLGGALLAVVKACIILGCGLLLLVRFPVMGYDWMHTSILVPVFLFAGYAVSVLLPADFAQSIADFIASYAR